MAEAGSTGDGLPILDPEKVAALRSLDSDDLPNMSKEIAGVFLTETPGKLQELRDAFGREDWRAARNAAHFIKGSAGHFSRRLWDVAEALEGECREQRAEAARVDQLAAALDEAAAAIRVEFGL